MNRESSAPCERATRIHLRIWAASFIAVILLLGFGTPKAHAQSYLQNVGTPSFTTSLPVENGFFNLSNGNLHLEIPFASYPQRAGRQYRAALVYDSAIWAPGSSAWTPTNVTTPAGAPSWGGWRLITSGDQGVITATTVQTSCFYYYFWSWTAPDGTRKSFPDFYTQADMCYGGTQHVWSGGGWASDGSGYFLAINNWCEPTLYAPDGTQIFTGGACWSTSQKWKDTNGNYYDTWDTIGRQPVSTTANCDSNSLKVCYGVYKNEGGANLYTVLLESVDVNTDFNSGITEYPGAITAIQSITLPDGTSYSFEYDSGDEGEHYGLLTSMTLPTGGVITFDYDNFTDSSYPAKTSRWVTSRVTPDGTWSYVPDTVTTCTESDEVNCEQKVTVTKPSGDVSVYNFRLNGGAWNSEVKHYTGSSTTGTLLATVARCFDFVTVTNGQCTYSVTTGSPDASVYQAGETTTLPIPGPTNISKTTAFTRDGQGNLTQVKEWPFYTGTLPSTPYRTTTTSYAQWNTTSYPNFWAKFILNRPEHRQVTDASGTVQGTWYSYDQVGTGTATGAQNHDDTNYGIGNYSRGNLTGTYGFLNGTDWLALGYMAYDMTGQLLYSWDPLNGIGNATVYSHADSFFTDPGNTSNPTACSGCPTTNAYMTAIARPIIGTSTFGYYYGTGQLAKSTDVNGQTAYSHYADPLSRPTATSLPNGGWSLSVYPSSSQTQVDTYAAITGSTSPSSGCTACRRDQVELDTLGRVKKTHLVSDPSGDTVVETEFDDNGRILRTSNPYRGTLDAWGTTPTYDGMNRVTEVKRADNDVAHTYYGAAVASAGGQSSKTCGNDYWGGAYLYPVLFVDEVGRKRQTWTDAFGRVQEVDEPDASGNLSVVTCYGSDLNNNLVAVGGTQTRSYTYDRLSRLLCKTEPETGTTYYYYEASGGTACGPPVSSPLCSGDPMAVCRRLDPRGVLTTYTYDLLNRLTQKSYSDSTPTAKYYYDSTDCLGVTCYNKGRRTGMSEGSGSTPTTKWAYDAVGNVLRESRAINGVTKTISYTYNLDGSIATITYPDSNRSVAYAYNNAQRATTASGNSVNYASLAAYAPNGAPSSIVNGYVSGGFAGVAESRTYNNRFQLTGILATSTAATALDLSYSYAQSSHNNGNITTQTNNESGGSGRTQTYTYDNLDRLLTAQAAASSGGDCWGQAFGNNASPPTLAADALANLFYSTSLKCSTIQPRYTMEYPNNNHFADTGMSYDSAGNNTADMINSYTYDAENRIVTATVSSTVYCFKYDADGIRTAKYPRNGSDCATSPTSAVLYWRNIAGNTIAETDKDGAVNNSSYHEYVFFAGRRIARADYGSSSFTVYYYFVDHLGNTRSMTAAAGSVCFKADYLPYGAENTPSGFTNSCNTSYKFTGYERDAETGLDYAFARYYNQRLGRFMSADPLGGDTGDPQSLNRYAYVRNNPINGTDPTGMFMRVRDGDINDLNRLDDIDPDDACFWYGVCNRYNFLGDPDPEPEQGGGGGGADGAGGGDGVAAVQRALLTLATAHLQNCLSELRDLGVTPATVRLGARLANVVNGVGSTVPRADTYRSNDTVNRAARGQLAGETVGSRLARPDVYAVADLGGHNIYVDPAKVSRYNAQQVLGLAFHEVLHNITGEGDGFLQDRLGIHGPGSSDRISNQLIRACF